MANEAYLHCTGPIHIWVLYRGIVTPIYLGTCEQHPICESEPQWEPVMNDLGGFMTPFDAGYQGAMEQVVMDLNRFNDGVLDVLESQPALDGFVGLNSPLARGTFLLENSCNFEMWLQYSFFGTVNALAFPDMGPGWHYPACRLGGIYTPKQGTKTMMRRAVVEAFNFFWGVGDNPMFTYKTNTAAAFLPLAGLVPS